MEKIKIKDILVFSKQGDKICVTGWVKTKRSSKNIFFISINDGSTINNLQIVIFNYFLKKNNLKKITTGSSVNILGFLCNSIGKLQFIELRARSIFILGNSSSNEYPLQSKKHSLEFLRDFLHFRFRTNIFSCIFRIRHAVNYSIHKFFHEKGFFYINTPIITSLDAEGAGESFRVTSLNIDNLCNNKSNNINLNDDFFGKEARLTVSGQLALESASLGLSNVYTFSPVFRSENSNTIRHLAEFWMLEVEMAFSDLNNIINLAESMIKYSINFVLDYCKDDIFFLNKKEFNYLNSNLNTLKILEDILIFDFEKINYTDAFYILKNSKNNFKYAFNDWGKDIQSEHEKYLLNYFKKPLIIKNYPKKVKPFYMRQNNDGITVSAMDVIFPFIGEIIGGSEREDRFNNLISSIKEKKIINIKDLSWYINTRLFGSVPHSGFGLGFDRFIQFITGMKNIRDVIPFPRTVKNFSC